MDKRTRHVCTMRSSTNIAIISRFFKKRITKMKILVNNAILVKNVCKKEKNKLKKPKRTGCVKYVLRLNIKLELIKTS